MSLSATFGVFVALGAVLTLLLVALRVLKRFSPTLGGSKNRLPMEVVQRLPLGPKQSIVVVRVGEKVMTMAVSGESIQQMGELDGDDRDAVLASSQTPVPFASSTSATTPLMTALAANKDLRALPGGSWLSKALAKKAEAPITAETITAETITAESITTAPVKAAPAVDPFRAMLGMALSSATKLAIAGLVLGALAWTPSRAAAQSADSATTPNAAAAPAAAAPAAAATAAAAPALPALPAATQSALYQQAMRAAALRAAAPARIGAGRNTQAPTTPGGQAAEGKPVASGATAPSGAAAADTMVARLAPQLDLRVGGGKGDGLRLSGTVGVVIMMGLLTLLPTLVLMMTGFTRILIVLHFLKQALGTQNAPPNHLVAALALLLTGFVMGPTLQTVNRDAIQPWLSGKMEQTEMMQVGVKPFREFMLRQTRERDIQTFVEMSHPEVAPKTIDDVPLVVVMSAFVTSELRTAFQLGFALFLPFIIIDIVVSSVLMSMGMMMLPPAMIALPCKLLLFVLVDGWTLVIQSLVQSFK
jgi:flagellar biosynthetic protein FliP